MEYCKTDKGIMYNGSAISKTKVNFSTSSILSLWITMYTQKNMGIFSESNFPKKNKKGEKNKMLDYIQRQLYIGLYYIQAIMQHTTKHHYPMSILMSCSCLCITS